MLDRSTNTPAFGFKRSWAQLAASLCLVSLLGCSSKTPSLARGGATAPSINRLAPLPVPKDPVPAAVATGLASLLDGIAPESAASLRALGGQAAAGRVAMREIELSPNGQRGLMARAEAAFCADFNCPTGIFDGSDSALRPVLLVMASSEPFIHAVSHLGRPDISLSEVASAQFLRTTRYRWDGAQYVPDTCSLIDRKTNVAGRCQPVRPEDVAMLSGSSTGLCAPIRQLLRESPSSIADLPMLQGAFLLRRDDTSVVQGLRLSLPSAGTEAISGLIRCLQRSGHRLSKSTSSSEDASGWPTTEWTGAVKGQKLRYTAVLSVTPILEKGYALFVIGMFRE